MVASANVAGIGTGLLVQQGVVGGAMLQQLQQQPLEILGGQGSPVQGSLLHSATLQGGNQVSQSIIAIVNKEKKLEHSKLASNV